MRSHWVRRFGCCAVDVVSERSSRYLGKIARKGLTANILSGTFVAVRDGFDSWLERLTAYAQLAAVLIIAWFREEA